MKSCPSTIAIFITVTLTCGKDLLNDQGIGKDNVFKHRIGAADAASNDEDQAIATAFGKRLCIPLDFELLCGRALVRAHIYKTPFVLYWSHVFLPSGTGW